MSMPHVPWFKSMSDLAPIITNVQNGTWHVAKYARVVSVATQTGTMLPCP